MYTQLELVICLHFGCICADFGVWSGPVGSQTQTIYSRRRVTSLYKSSTTRHPVDIEEHDLTVPQSQHSGR
eukprot:1949270-Amphidinium_carterae.1